MKLPDNNKERIQVFVLIGIGVVAVLYAMWQLLVSPFIESKQKLKDTLQVKQDKLAKAERELKHAPAIKAEFDEMTAQLDRTINSNALQAILGSYLVGVTETLESQARASNLKLDEIQEIGIRELPRAKKKGDTSTVYFKSYSVQVSARTSYDHAVSFIKHLEDLNPYLCVSDIRITSQPDDPEHHRFNLRIEWPIEANPKPKQVTVAEHGDGS